MTVKLDLLRLVPLTLKNSKALKLKLMDIGIVVSYDAPAPDQLTIYLPTRYRQPHSKQLKKIKELFNADDVLFLPAEADFMDNCWAVSWFCSEEDLIDLEVKQR